MLHKWYLFTEILDTEEDVSYLQISAIECKMIAKRDVTCVRIRKIGWKNLEQVDLYFIKDDREGQQTSMAGRERRQPADLYYKMRIVHWSGSHRVNIVYYFFENTQNVNVGRVCANLECARDCDMCMNIVQNFLENITNKFFFSYTKMLFDLAFNFGEVHFGERFRNSFTFTI